MDAVVAADVHFHSHVELVKCESCEFTEECTLPYISQIKEHYNGRWICGLCMEAVKLPFSDADHPISLMGSIISRRLRRQD
nr:hypothetical protein [Tanacetum cinerariifolium]